MWRSLRPWVKLELLNALDNDKLIGWDTTIAIDPASALDANGLPTGFLQGARFGTAVAELTFSSQEAELAYIDGADATTGAGTLFVVDALGNREPRELAQDACGLRYLGIGGSRKLELLAAREITWDLKLASWGKQEPTAQEVKDAFEKADRALHEKEKKSETPDKK